MRVQRAPIPILPNTTRHITQRLQKGTKRKERGKGRRRSRPVGDEVEGVAFFAKGLSGGGDVLDDEPLLLRWEYRRLHLLQTGSHLSADSDESGGGAAALGSGLGVSLPAQPNPIMLFQKTKTSFIEQYIDFFL